MVWECIEDGGKRIPRRELERKKNGRRIMGIMGQNKMSS